MSILSNPNDVPVESMPCLLVLVLTRVRQLAHAAIMVNFPKELKSYCRNEQCKNHQDWRVSQYKVRSLSASTASAALSLSSIAPLLAPSHSSCPAVALFCAR